MSLNDSAMSTPSVRPEGLTYLPAASCGQDDLPAPLPANDPTTKAQMNEILRAAGADAACLQAANDEFENHSSSGSMSVDMGAGPFDFVGSMDVDGGFHAAGSNTESSTLSEGCSQLVIQAAETIHSARNIACAVQNASTVSSGTMFNNASVEIFIPPGSCEAMQQGRLDLLSAMLDSAERISGRHPELGKRMMDSFTRLLEKESDNVCGSVLIEDTTVRARVTAELYTSNVSTLTSSNRLKSEIEEVVKQEANNALRANLGRSTNVPDTKTVVDQKFQSSKTAIQANVINNASQTHARADNNGKVTITAPKSIVLRNTVVDSTIDATLKAEAIMSAATESGMELAMSILSEAVTESTSDVTTEQMAPIVKAMNEANAAAIEAQMRGHADAINAGGKMRLAEMGIAAVVVVVVAKFIQGFNNRGGGYDAQPQYNPALCVGYKTFPESFGRYFQVVGAISMLIKIHFVLFVFQQLKRLMSHSSMLLTPWNWGKLNLGQYIMNVVWSLVAFKIYCSLLHGTTGLGDCFSLVNERADPNLCTLGADGDYDYESDSTD